MVVKKTTNPGTNHEGNLVKRKLRGGNFSAKAVLKNHVHVKNLRRHAKVDHRSEDLEVITLTVADFGRIEEICAHDMVVTDSVWNAIAKPWKPTSF